MKITAALLATTLAANGKGYKAWKKITDKKANKLANQEKQFYIWDSNKPDPNTQQCDDSSILYQATSKYFKPSIINENNGMSGRVRLDDYGLDMSCHIAIEAAPECNAIRIELVSLAMEKWQNCWFDQMRWQWQNDAGETLQSQENCGCFGDGCHGHIMNGAGTMPYRIWSFNMPWAPLHTQNKPKTQVLTINQNKFKVLMSTDEMVGGGNWEFTWDCIDAESPATTVIPDPMSGETMTNQWVSTTAFPYEGPVTIEPFTHGVEETTWTQHFEWTTAWVHPHVIKTTTPEPTTVPVESCKNHFSDHYTFQQAVRERIAEVVASSWIVYSKADDSNWNPKPYSEKNQQKTQRFTRWLTNVWDQSARHINEDRKCATMLFDNENPGLLSKDILGADCLLGITKEKSLSGWDWGWIDSACDKIADYFDWLYANCNVPPPVAMSRKQKLLHRCERIKEIERDIVAINNVLYRL